MQWKGMEEDNELRGTHTHLTHEDFWNQSTQEEEATKQPQKTERLGQLGKLMQDLETMLCATSRTN